MRTSKEIREIFKSNKISGYRLEKDLGITQVGADKFLNGETKKPYKTTLKLYNSYIDNGFKPIEKESIENDSNEDKIEKITSEKLIYNGVEIPDQEIFNYIAENDDRLLADKSSTLSLWLTTKIQEGVIKVLSANNRIKE